MTYIFELYWLFKDQKLQLQNTPLTSQQHRCHPTTNTFTLNLKDRKKYVSLRCSRVAADN